MRYILDLMTSIFKSSLLYLSRYKPSMPYTNFNLFQYFNLRYHSKFPRLVGDIGLILSNVSDWK